MVDKKLMASQARSFMESGLFEYLETRLQRVYYQDLATMAGDRDEAFKAAQKAAGFYEMLGELRQIVDEGEEVQRVEPI